MASPIINIPSSQRAVVSIGADKNPLIQSVPTPSFDPNGDLILIRVKASSINPVDYIAWLYNDYFMKQPLPFILGWDFSGEIVAVGKKAVRGWKVGDEVFGQANVGKNGTHTDYCLVDGLRITKKPDNLTHSQAASVSIALTTAYDGIVNLAELSSKKTILISGASGGLGHFAVQLSKLLYGATVIAFTSQPEGIELLKALSADYIIDYKKDDVQKKVFEITGGKGVDVVFDLTGGRSYSLTASLVKEGGKFIGVDANPPSKDTPFYKILEERKVDDVLFANIGHVADFRHFCVKYVTAPQSLAAELLTSGSIRVHLSQTISLNEVPEVLLAMKNGKTFVGKVAVQY